jgi:hypothetical protein
MSSQLLLPFLRYSIISLQKTLGGNHHPPSFLEHQEAVNAFPSQEDPYLAPRKDFFINRLLGSGIMVLQS